MTPEGPLGWIWVLGFGVSCFEFSIFFLEGFRVGFGV